MRNRSFLALDIVLFTSVVLLSFAARYEGIDSWAAWQHTALVFIAVCLPIKLGVFYRMGMYRRLWRYASVSDLEVLMLAFFASAITSFVVGVALLPWLHLTPTRVPLTILLSESALTGAAIALPRLLQRVLARRVRSFNASDRRRRHRDPAETTRVL